MTKLEELQQELATLRKERKKITLEKGLSALDNKDLRENGAYLATEQRENYYTARVLKVMRDIDKLTKRPKPVKKASSPKGEKKYEFKPHKWQ